MRKIISGMLVVIVIMATLLCGCGKVDPIVGTWEAKISHKALTSGEITETGGVMDYLNYDNIYKIQRYTFNEEGYYTLTVDIDQYIADYTAATMDGLSRYYADIIAENELDITVEEAFELDGISEDNIIDQASLDDLNAEKFSEGRYEVKDGKLYLSAGKEYAVDEAVYTTYEIVEDELRMLSQIGGDALEASLLPLTFKKVAE